MAKRLLFSAINLGGNITVLRKEIEFKWAGGFAKIQKIRRLENFKANLLPSINEKHMEISSGSDTVLGKSLSAFNLSFKSGDLKGFTVESVYQGSKIMDTGGPYQELYNQPSIVTKKDPRIRSAEKLIGFRLLEDDWPTTPPTGFYNYLYFLALLQNKMLINPAIKYEYFSDLEFNHEKAISCQAESLAIFFACIRVNLAEDILSDKSYFLNFIDKIEYITNFDLK